MRCLTETPEDQMDVETPVIQKDAMNVDVDQQANQKGGKSVV
jgi:hypothetical protein